MWKDKKLVYLMSTNCQPTGDSTVKRRNHDGTAQQVPCLPVSWPTISIWGVWIEGISITGSGAKPENFTGTFFGYSCV